MPAPTLALARHVTASLRATAALLPLVIVGHSGSNRVRHG
jgi:hypothetical protein